MTETIWLWILTGGVILFFMYMILLSIPFAFRKEPKPRRNKIYDWEKMGDF